VSGFLSRVLCPEAVLSEVKGFDKPLESLLAIDLNALPALRRELPLLANWAQGLIGTMEEAAPALLLDFSSNVRRSLHLSLFRRFSVLLGYCMGDLIVQNENGDRLITVYDRDRTKSMREGARYHQTREGGSIHTDNVNIPERWHFLLLTCLEQAPVGGENILVDGRRVYSELKERFPKVLQTLENSFWWEKRGVADALYQAPIIVMDNGQPLFRHLRPYMESAHEKAGEPMTEEQVYAVDVLDALTNSTEMQVRYRMRPFETLLTVDAQVLHGRQCFSDDLDALELPKYLNLGNDERGRAKLRRTMERLWIRA
jgi:hypothetical protein